MATFTCTRPGCGRSGLAASELDTPNLCVFHHGKPVFHEGRKGWSCCKRRVDTFEDFVAIPGCTHGQHTDIPLEDESITALLENARKESVAEIASGVSSKEISAPKNNPPAAPARSLIGHGYTLPSAATARNSPQLMSQLPADQKPSVFSIEDDPADAAISPGAPCQRNGCEVKYVEGMERSANECSFHPGVAVFHEGSKGWSCCKTKVLDFTQFLSIRPCTTGKHRFVPPPKMGGDDLRECRHDFFQIGPKATVCVYAKAVDAEKSSITFTNAGAIVRLTFKDGMRYEHDFKFPSAILPESSTYRVLSTKVEMSVTRAPGTSTWPPNDLD